MAPRHSPASVQQPEQFAVVHFTGMSVPQPASKRTKDAANARIMDATLHAALSSARHDFG
jgi:hypothetical protein